MNTLVVYHGGIEKIENPVCKLGRKHMIKNGLNSLSEIVQG